MPLVGLPEVRALGDCEVITCPTEASITDEG
jgi:hypothetical protein